MNEVLYIFEEAIENGWLKELVTVVRKNGRIIDYVLPNEPIQDHENVSQEVLNDVVFEISGY